MLSYRTVFVSVNQRESPAQKHLAAAKIVGLGTCAAVLNEIAPRGRIFDRDGDLGVVRADAERLIDNR